MPIYEYRCDNCGHELEAIQKISEDPLKYCPKCEQDTLKKRVSAPGFRLKGGGWYETDFKSGNKKNVADSDKGGSGSSDNNGSSSSSDSSSSSSSDSGSSSSSDSSSSSSGSASKSD